MLPRKCLVRPTVLRSVAGIITSHWWIVAVVNVRFCAIAVASVVHNLNLFSWWNYCFEDCKICYLKMYSIWKVFASQYKNTLFYWSTWLEYHSILDKPVFLVERLWFYIRQRCSSPVNVAHENASIAGCLKRTIVVHQHWVDGVR